MKVSPKFLTETIDIWDYEKCRLSYNYLDKADAHKKAKRLLTYFAQNYLGLTKDQFEVRSNKGGDAVSGEVTLHTDPFINNKGIYIQISQSCMGPRMTVMFRVCDSRKDYTGYHNNFGDMFCIFGNADDMDTFADQIRYLCLTEKNRF